MVFLQSSQTLNVIAVLVSLKYKIRMLLLVIDVTVNVY